MRTAVMAGLVASLVVAGSIFTAPAANAADTWTGTRSCSSPATQGRLASTTTGVTTHFRDGVQVLYAAGGYRVSYHPLGIRSYKVTANTTISSVAWSCIGA